MPLDTTEEPELDVVLQALREEGVRITQQSVKKHHTQGYMSNVYQIRADGTPAILHIVDPSPEQIRQRTWEKIPVVMGHLRQETELPVPEVLASGVLEDGKYFTLQQKLPGAPAGAMILRGGTFQWDWATQTDRKFSALSRALAQLHSVQSQKHGFLNSKMNGRYPAWKDFLKQSASEYLEHIKKHNPERTEDVDGWKDIIEGIIEEYEYDGPARILHGDIINPGNVLYQEDTVSAVLDWEWALAGDPAWEFAWAQYLPLEPYIEERERLGIPVVGDLARRVALVRPLWTLWAASSHAHGNPFTEPLIAQLKKDLEAFNPKMKAD